MGLLSTKTETGQDALSTIDLPSPIMTGGLPIMDALRLRRSEREFQSQPLPYQVVSNLLWAAYGINRPESNGRTAPSAINCQEVDVYAVVRAGIYLYDPVSHSLQLVASGDILGSSGYLDFADQAPFHLVYVANRARTKLIPVAFRRTFTSVSAGSIAQNVHLFCASEGMATVIRAWIPRSEMKKAMHLRTGDQVLFSQTVGFAPSHASDG